MYRKLISAALIASALTAIAQWPQPPFQNDFKLIDLLQTPWFAAPPQQPTDGHQALIFRNQQRLSEDGTIPHGALLAAKAQLDEALLYHYGPGVQMAGVVRPNWVWLGPGNIGGRIREILIHPTNHNTMYAGAASGGVWRTNSAGANWFPIGDFLASISISCMAFEPGNPNVIYVGTGESFTGGNEGASLYSSMRGAGIFKSTDAGQTWNQILTTDGSEFYYVNRIAISPTSAAIMLVATNAGLFYTFNGGGAWIYGKIGANNITQRVVDVDFHPTDGNRAVAGLANGSALYSTDGGRNWQTATGLGGARVELAYARSAPATVWASVDRNLGEVWRSTDGGQTYSRRNTGNNYLAVQTTSIGYWTNALWVDPTDANRVVVGGIDLWRGTDNGTSLPLTRVSDWQLAPAQSAHADHHAIVHHPTYGTGGANNRTVFFGNDGGVYRTNDVTAVTTNTGWTALNNELGVTQFYHGIASADGRTIFGGAQDNGTIRTRGGTENWTQFLGGDGGFVAADRADSNALYGSSQYGGIARSTDGGATSQFINGQHWNGTAWVWKAAPYRITDAQNQTINFIAPFILDPNNSDRAYVGGRSLWRSNDVKTANTATTGPTWTAIRGPITGNPNISAIAVARGNSNVLWIAYTNGQIYFSANATNATPTFTRVDLNDPNLPKRWVSKLLIDPLNHRRVYVSFMGYQPRNFWVTENDGTNWTQRTGNGVAAQSLPNVPVSTIALSPRKRGWLYAGTDVGVYTSFDDGRTWKPTNDGPVNVTVDELFWKNQDTLVAATHGRGMYAATIYRRAGDADGNDLVDDADLALVLTDFGQTGVRAGDLNDSGNVDDTDLAVVLENFGKGTDYAVLSNPATGVPPTKLAVNHVTNRLYVSCETDKTVEVYNLIDNSRITAINLNLTQNTHRPGYIAVNPNTNKIYVMIESFDRNVSSQIKVIDGWNNSIVKTISLGGSGAGGVGVNPGTNRVYAAYVIDDVNNIPGLAVIDGATDAKLTQIACSSTGFEATAVYGIAVNRFTNKIYMLYRGGTQLDVFNGANNTRIKSLNIGNQSVEIAVNPFTNKIYTANLSRSRVEVFDGTTDEFETSFNNHQSLFGIAVDPFLNHGYLVRGGTPGSIRVINLANGATIKNITVQNEPRYAVPNPYTNRVYCTNGSSRTYSVIERPAR